MIRLSADDLRSRFEQLAFPSQQHRRNTGKTELMRELFIRDDALMVLATFECQQQAIAVDTNIARDTE